MDPALQRRVQRYGWDKASVFYEAFWSRQLLPAQELLLEMAALRPGERVLDVACGTGLVSFRAANLVGVHGHVTGTDISGKMVEACREKAARDEIVNMDFERMDAEELILGQDPYDKALCALGLMYMPEPIKALGEMWRFVNSGGTAIAAVWGRRDHCGWSKLFAIVDSHVASEVCPMFFNLGNPDMLRLSFEAAGFKDVESKTISSFLQFANAEEACGAAFAGGPVALVYHKFNDEIRNQVHREYLDSIAPFLKNNGYEIPGEFVVAKGVKP